MPIGFLGIKGESFHVEKGPPKKGRHLLAGDKSCWAIVVIGTTARNFQFSQTLDERGRR